MCGPTLRIQHPANGAADAGRLAENDELEAVVAHQRHPSAHLLVARVCHFVRVALGLEVGGWEGPEVSVCASLEIDVGSSKRLGIRLEEYPSGRVNLISREMFLILAQRNDFLWPPYIAWIKGLLFSIDIILKSSVYNNAPPCYHPPRNSVPPVSEKVIFIRSY